MPQRGASAIGQDAVADHQFPRLGLLLKFLGQAAQFEKEFLNRKQVFVRCGTRRQIRSAHREDPLLRHGLVLRCFFRGIAIEKPHIFIVLRNLSHVFFPRLFVNIKNARRLQLRHSLEKREDRLYPLALLCRPLLPLCCHEMLLLSYLCSAMLRHSAR